MIYRLNIGGGNLPLEGFTNIDKYYYPDSPWELTNKALAEEWKSGKYEGGWAFGDALDLKFPAETFDEVNMSHVLEHLSMEEGNLAIMEAYRVLKPGGFLVVGVPNLRKACEEYLKTDYIQEKDNSHWYYVMGMIYGTTGKDGEGQFHHCGYSPQYLTEVLKLRSFKDIVEVAPPAYHKAEFNFCLKGFK
jgi:ubiquinone/menaquinone biosynthesis C-methylase UbiE